MWWAAERASRLGERHDAGWLVYHPLQTLSYHRAARADAPAMARALRDVLPDARRYVDVGAGGGALAAELVRHGLDVALCEHGLAGRLLARRTGMRCGRLDLTRDPPARLAGTFDVACCLEVAEHVDERLGDVLACYLAALAKTIVFSAAHPGQGGRGHVNEQPQAYWIERFERCGADHRPDLSRRLAEAFRGHRVEAPWYADNVMAFECSRHARP
jgi:SAM-dependent methyltransferase